MSKLIFVTGGVCSSLGKDVASAALAGLLESAGLKVAIIRCVPYVNVDASNINPFQRGEAYITDDGTETDLKMSNYARFSNAKISWHSTISTGSVFKTVIENERRGIYKGRTVQIIPHITDEIKRRILQTGIDEKSDVTIVEIGGTVGDIETIPFLETTRQMLHEAGRGNAICIHLTLIPAIIGGELKTKPTQHSVKILQQAGICPDILLCRSNDFIDEAMRRKVALFCNVRPSDVFSSIDLQESIYELPIVFHNQGIDAKILEKLRLEAESPNVEKWTNLVETRKNAKKSVKIALIATKGDTKDCHKTIRDALSDAAIMACGVKVDLLQIELDGLPTKSDGLKKVFDGVKGIVVEENCGLRGFASVLKVVEFARKNKIPFFGIDFGMHIMAIETARNILHWDDADSSEFVDRSEHLVVGLPEEQSAVLAMRNSHFGLEALCIDEDSIAAASYGQTCVSERHRNKYTFFAGYEKIMQENGLRTVAKTSDGQMTEIFEWADHPWGVGVQFHPEFLSKPTQPHPLFASFVKATLES